jgi:Ser/Thr protein kinase RdoA (MazF antagonist)
MILRAAYRSDRPFEQIQAEVDFVNYLADGGARVSRALPSEDGNLVERLEADGLDFIVVAFEKAPGLRLPDNGYRYREGVSLDEYFQNWGRTLGKMHALTKRYRPSWPDLRRPTLLATHPASEIDRLIPENLVVVREKLLALLARVERMPTPADSYGLIHADFNDGNFCVDYENGDITAFDFDDACYCWFAKELADAWDGGAGWCAREPDPRRRREFMRHYMEQVMLGYDRENTPDPSWLEDLPFFLKLVEMEDLLCRLGYAADNELHDAENESAIKYLVRCVEEDIPYLGLFDPIFSPEHPLSLDWRTCRRWSGSGPGSADATSLDELQGRLRWQDATYLHTHLRVDGEDPLDKSVQHRPQRLVRLRPPARRSEAGERPGQDLVVDLAVLAHLKEADRLAFHDRPLGRALRGDDIAIDSVPVLGLRAQDEAVGIGIG